MKIQMKSTQSGKGLIPILLVVGVILVIVFFAGQNNLWNRSSPQKNNEKPMTEVKGEVALMLDPVEATASVGQTFNLEVKMDTKNDTVTAAELHLTFDPAYLEATMIQNSSFLPVTLKTLKPEEMVAGKVSIVVGSNPSTPQKGMGSVAKVTFKAKKMGMTEIKFDGETKVAAIGKTGSVLGTTNQASVTIK